MAQHTEIRGTRPTGPKRYISAKPVGRFVPQLTKTAFQKHGFSSVALFADWDQIIGQPQAKYSIPERLKWPRGARSGEGSGHDSAQRSGATLILRTDAAHALETEYASAQIIERINAYFGYRAVATVKIVQGPVTGLRPQTRPQTPSAELPTPKNPRAIARPATCDALLATVEDDGLKAALERMSQGVFANS